MSHQKAATMTKAPLLTKSKSAVEYDGRDHHMDKDLESFRTFLRWICMDHTTIWTSVISSVVFLIFVLIIPLLSHFVFPYQKEDRESYDAVVETSLSAVATLSFGCLMSFFNKYGLASFLFIDKLPDETESVRRSYKDKLNGSFKMLSIFVIPGFAAETGYKIWANSSGLVRDSFFGNPNANHIIICMLDLCSWLYRTSTFFLVCVIFRLICHLQILRLKHFTIIFEEKSDDILFLFTEHIKIRKQLNIISHRFRLFIISTIFLITVSLLASVVITTTIESNVNFFNAGELALCSIGTVMGTLICLRSAAKITHKGQAITSHAAKWHAFATIISSRETQGRRLDSRLVREEDMDELESGKSKIPSTKEAHTIPFQKRQAFVTYLENNRAGITLYGFMLDRTSLHMIFAMELTLFLWLLGKTLGIS